MKKLATDKLFIYKWMIFDENRQYDNFGRQTAKQVGAIYSECNDCQDDDLFEIDPEYDRIPAMFKIWDFLYKMGVGIGDTYFGDFMDYALDHETIEHHTQFVKEHPLC